jgi:hypothetical protein
VAETLVSSLPHAITENTNVISAAFDDVAVTEPHEDQEGAYQEWQFEVYSEREQGPVLDIIVRRHVDADIPVEASKEIDDFLDHPESGSERKRPERDDTEA